MPVSVNRDQIAAQRNQRGEALLGSLALPELQIPILGILVILRIMCHHPLPTPFSGG